MRMWRQAAVAAAGLWLMVAPAMLGYGRPASESDWICGPIVATLGIMAMSRAIRAVRWANLPIAAWLMIGPLVAGYPGDAVASSMGVGVTLIALNAYRSSAAVSLGGGWRAVW
jgi:hypothetical protein